jgi:pimeloyl-ACP methyl ester carboxylesterase
MVPIASRAKDIPSLIRFSRNVSPGSPMLVTPALPAGERDKDVSACVHDRYADRVGYLIGSVLQTNGLSLIPVVLLGHGDGAGLGAHIALRHGTKLAACIFLRPNSCPSTNSRHELQGVYVLLAWANRVRAASVTAEHLGAMLEAAGAEVIRERVLVRPAPGGEDSALCRVFLSALFNPPHSEERRFG